MSIDMTQFHQLFFDESFEGLEDMESALLELSRGAGDPELIHTIFRAAHSIKGGGGTFGFTAISDFTHAMETLLDEMRGEQRSIDEQGLNLVLDSVDVLREMLKAARDGKELDVDRVAASQARLEAALLDRGTGAAEVSRSNGSLEAPAGWKIDFRPYPQLMKTGNDPVRMIHELAGMGELTVEVDTDGIPGAADFDPEECYLAWKLVLVTDASLEQINEIFEWVDGDCDLDIQMLCTDKTGVPVDGARDVDADAGPGEPVSLTATQQRDDDRRQLERRSATESTIRVNTTKIDELINMVGELVITQSMLSQAGNELESGNSKKLEKLRNGLEQLERNSRELQESVLRMRMFPISFSFNRFPRMVHDLSVQLGKRVELKLSGETTELDKTVMEKIGDPLVHLVRNALDHGIETPRARRERGKPETGVLHLNACHQGGHIVIEVSDDGNGLPKDKILEKARALGLVGEGENLSHDQVLDLIFRPGFSTVDEVSDLSGRGVGMDVVRQNIRSLGGSIEVSSAAGTGTTFTVRLPLTLAIVDGQAVRVGQETYIIQLVSILESLQVSTGSVCSIAGETELFRLRDEYIPVVRLHRLFGVTPASTRLRDGIVVIIEEGGRKAGLFVDELQGQQQYVIKSLETNFRNVPGISGATILGDGRVALIVDVAGLVRLAYTDREGSDYRPVGADENAA